MKNRTVRILSVVLSLIMSLGIFVPAVSATSESELIYTSVKLVPDGEFSETGYLKEKWVDENGNDAVISDGEASKFKTSKAANLPSHYSSAEQGYVTSVKDQNPTKVCWAFSAIAAAETSLLKKGYITENDAGADLSESHLTWFTHKSLTSNANDPTYGDGTNLQNPYDLGGFWLRSTFTLARGVGFALEEDYPYYASDVSLMSNLKESDRYVSNFSLNSAYNIPSSETNAIKQAISDNGSVMVAAHINTAYLNKGADGYAYYQNYTNETNHEMIIIGWDDNFSVNNFASDVRPESNGAWLVKNSYGTSFGDNGFFWISYDDPSLSLFVVQDVSPAVSGEKIYQYDGYGYSEGRVAKSENTGQYIQTASQANVFTAERNEMINAVSFYTMQHNVNYKIEVYKDVTANMSTPTAGAAEPAYVSEGVVKYKGYSKIQLDRNIPVKEGESYSVVITLSVSADGVGIYLPFEGKSANDGIYDRYYSSKQYQSYYKFGNFTWECSSGNANLNNVCVKAFTVPDNSLEISTYEQFNAFALEVAGGKTYEGKNVNLVNDIDFSGKEITPVGTEENAFNGHFFGNGYVIKNGEIKSENNYIGLFSKLEASAFVERVGIENVTVEGVQGVGAVAGQNNGTIKYCYSTGSVKGESCVGGIAGINRGTVSYCYSLADITADDKAGLLVGASLSGKYEKSVVKALEMKAIGNAESTEIASFSETSFSSGEVAFYLDDAGTVRRNVWTKRDGITTFQKSKDEAIYRIELFAPADYSSLYLYVTSDENLVQSANASKLGFSAKIYADAKCTKEYYDTPKANMMLYVVWIEYDICEHNISFVEKNATCTENGIKKHYVCDKCGIKAWDENLSDIILDVSQISIPATGHTVGEWFIKEEATCTADGEKVLECSVCGETIGKEILPAGHIFPDKSQWVQSEENDNIYLGYCQRGCGYADSEKRIPIIKEIALSRAAFETPYVKNAVAFTLETSVINEDIEVVWSSSDESVATVDRNGNVTTHKKGTAVITATVVNSDGTKCSADCTVTVTYTFLQWLICIFLLGFIWYFK